MASVAFDYSLWSLRYPELAGSVKAALATMYFSEATLFLDNSDNSRVTDLVQRAMLLNMLVAHIAALNAPMNGQPSAPLVGRIASATEGSVTVAATMDLPPGSAQWFAQTKYGAAFWAATAVYRTMLYVPGCGY